MGSYYTVQQGDYLSKIAADNGFTDYHTIWDHPNNADLKRARDNPNVLFPGDQVFVPEREQHVESRPTEKHHTFVVSRQPLKLRLVLEDAYEQPIANAKCTLVVQNQGYPLTTDASGKIEQVIPATAQDGSVVITDDQTPYQNQQIPLKIGSLDPVDQVSGQIARLNNLGYFAADLDDLQGSDAAGIDPADESSDSSQAANSDQFRSAVEEFQCDQGLTVDGICGPQTQAKLKQMHGC